MSFLFYLFFFVNVVVEMREKRSLTNTNLYPPLSLVPPPLSFFYLLLVVVVSRQEQVPMLVVCDARRDDQTNQGTEHARRGYRVCVCVVGSRCFPFPSQQLVFFCAYLLGKTTADVPTCSRMAFSQSEPIATELPLGLHSATNLCVFFQIQSLVSSSAASPLAPHKEPARRQKQRASKPRANARERRRPRSIECVATCEVHPDSNKATPSALALLVFSFWRVPCCFF